MRLTRLMLLCAGLALMSACGDPPTPDGRGYTKAPLERPAPMIRGEVPGPMRVFGTPRLPVARELQLETGEG